MKLSWTDVIGAVAMVVSAGAMILTGVANDRKMEEKIGEAVVKALTDKTKA